jgi:predicted RNA-binding Zn-ribbon protein involved in translation (DUF1610 family)
MDVETQVCPTCGVDLSIFDVGKNGEIDLDDVKIEDTKSLDDLLEEISKSEDIPTDIVEDLKSIGNDTKVDESGAKEPTPESGKPSEELEVSKKASAPEAKAPKAKPDGKEAEVKPEVEVEGAKPEAKKDEEMFECPSCGTELPVSSNVCYNCGVEFVDEQATQFECPECHTMVSISADKCPKCGAQFEVQAITETIDAAEGLESEVKEELSEEVKAAKKLGGDVDAQDEAVGETGIVEEPGKEVEKDPYQKLQELVEEVKPLLLIAKRYDIDVSEGKLLINKAIMAGRNKDAKAALEFVKKSKEIVEEMLNRQISDRIKKLNEEVKEAKSRGFEIDVAEKMTESRKALKSRDYETAIQSYFKANEDYEMSSGDYIEVKGALNLMTEVISNSEVLQFEVSDVGKHIDKLKGEMDKGNWKKANKIAEEGKQKVMRTLPPQIKREIKKARSLLIEWKAKNKDITKPIKFLKEANIAMKKEDIGEALRNLVSFKKETKSLG